MGEEVFFRFVREGTIRRWQVISYGYMWMCVFVRAWWGRAVWIISYDHWKRNRIINRYSDMWRNYHVKWTSHNPFPIPTWAVRAIFLVEVTGTALYVYRSHTGLHTVTHPLRTRLLDRKRTNCSIQNTTLEFCGACGLLNVLQQGYTQPPYESQVCIVRGLYGAYTTQNTQRSPCGQLTILEILFPKDNFATISNLPLP